MSEANCIKDHCCWEDQILEDTPLEEYCDPKTGQIKYPELELDFPDSHLNTARNNIFLFLIHTPRCLKDRFKVERFLIGLQKVNIPQIAIPSVIKPYVGSNFKFSTHGREPFQAITTTFKIDTKWKRYKFMYDWLNAFSDPEKGFIQTETNISLYTKMELIHFNEKQEPSAKWTYELGFPTSLSQIEMDSTVSEPSEIICTATFDFSLLSFEPLDPKY